MGQLELGPVKWSVGRTFILLLICLAVEIHCVEGNECLGDERDALLAFKSGFDDRMGRLHSWKGLNCCSWEGILCSPSNGHIIRLHLHNPSLKEYYYEDEWALRGSINNALFRLQHLEHLDLSGNDFNSTPIPPEIGAFKYLRYLSLSGANFGGNISPQLGNLSRLQHLDLSGSDLDGSIPLELGSLSQLQHLDLSANYNLENPSFSWVTNLTALRHLSLDRVNFTMAGKHWGNALPTLPRLEYFSMSGCEISGVIPPSLFNFTSLAYLDLSNNDFHSQSVSDLSRAPWPHLATLNIGSTQIGETFLCCIANFTSLTHLDLSNNSIRGVIPNSIASLSALQVLQLAGNNLSGVIPTTMDQLSRLTSLNLGCNQLNGTIPPFLSHLSSLTDLDLRNNRLSGSIPPSLNNLSSLRYLDLSQNQLSGTIPPSLAQLYQLQHLDLSSNRICGSISLSLFQNLSSLQSLDLSENPFTGYNYGEISIPQFQLWILCLRSCNIVGEIPSFISTQLELDYLDLSHNRLGGDIPSWLWDLPLSYLNMSHNLFNMPLPLPNSFGGYFLDLSENQFNGFTPTQFGEYNCQSLIYLSLRGNNLNGSIPPPLSQCTNLKLLDLSDNHLSGSLPPGLSNCSSLKVLNLANNELHGEIPEQLGMLKYLQTLQLCDNRLSGPLPTILQNWTLLQFLDMGHNNITGDIPRWIGNLSELIVLSLSFNHFTGTIPSQIIRLHKLQILDLSFNKLEGELPKNLKNLLAMAIPPKNTNLFNVDLMFYAIYASFKGYFNTDRTNRRTYQARSPYQDEANLRNKGQEMHYVQNILSLVTCIDLSGNALYGEIPNEMGLLRGLHILNLSRNHFKGEIPEQLGGMSSLESLDVSENELSGKIALALQSLTALSVLNVSNNKLSGKIPEGNQFLTFNASSFEDNSDLCGRQLNKECGDGRSGDWPAAPPHLSNASGEEEEIPWWNVGVGLSYAVGLSGVYFVLAMNRRWRREYFRLMDKIIIPIVVKLGFT